MEQQHSLRKLVAGKLYSTDDGGNTRTRYTLNLRYFSELKAFIFKVSIQVSTLKLLAQNVFHRSFFEATEALQIARQVSLPPSRKYRMKHHTN